MNHIYFGVVTKAQGLRGEFRVKNDISVLALKNIKKILIDNTEYSLSKVIDRQTFVVLKVDELNDINQVEKNTSDLEKQQDSFTSSSKNFLDKNILINPGLAISTFSIISSLILLAISSAINIGLFLSSLVSKKATLVE